MTNFEVVNNGHRMIVVGPESLAREFGEQAEQFDPLRRLGQVSLKQDLMIEEQVENDMRQFDEAYADYLANGQSG